MASLLVFCSFSWLFPAVEVTMFEFGWRVPPPIRGEEAVMPSLAVDLPVVVLSLYMAMVHFPLLYFWATVYSTMTFSSSQLATQFEWICLNSPFNHLPLSIPYFSHFYAIQIWAMGAIVDRKCRQIRPLSSNPPQNRVNNLLIVPIQFHPPIQFLK